MSTPSPKLPQEQPNPLTPSVSTGTSVIAGAPAALILVWLWDSFLPSHVIPAEIAASIGACISALTGYFAKGGKAVHTVQSIVIPLIAVSMCLAVSLQVSGCSLFPAKTFTEKYAAGISTATAALTTTDTLLNVGKLKPQDARNIERQVDNVKEALDIANTAYITDQTTGNNKLSAALTSLSALTTYLTQQQSK